jgi:hypothetical protein
MAPEDYPIQFPQSTTCIYSLALSFILHFHKTSPSSRTPFNSQSINLLFGLSNPIRGPPTRPTKVAWETMHLLAQVHAMLYSLRILKQSMDWISTYQIPQILPEEVERELKTLQWILNPMPQISDLFLDVRELRAACIIGPEGENGRARAAFTSLIREVEGLDPSRSSASLDDHGFKGVDKHKRKKDKQDSANKSTKKKAVHKRDSLLFGSKNVYDLLDED